ncbi:MAG TPA: siphovirus Gp157 family protein [Paenisporosarcina sp.]|nr:siphovirus Gp157 family protein [Paenisporosarcina sp.]
MRLYEMSANYQQILSLIEDGQEGLEDTLESLTDAIEDKVENIGKLIKTIDAEAAGLKAEEQRLADRRKSLENNTKRLKLYAEQSMQDAGMKKIKGQLFTFSIQKNPPSLEVSNDSVIPEIFFTEQEPLLNKAALKEALKDGQVIDGAYLVQKESLRIK